MAGIYTTVARGTVTRANMKINAAEGVSFVDFGYKYQSDFSAGASGWAITAGGTVTGNIDGISGEDDTLRFYADGSTGSHAIYLNTAYRKGMRYKISYRYYIPSTNTNLKQVAATINSHGTGSIGTTLDAWTEAGTFIDPVMGHAQVVYIFGRTSAGAISFTGANSSTDDLFYIKDVKLEEFPPTNYLGHLLKIRDSSGRAIQGFIKAAGTGETEGDEEITAWNNNVTGYDTLTVNVNGHDLDSIISDGTGVSMAYTNNCLTVGELYKIVTDITLTSGTSPLFKTKRSTASPNQTIISNIIDKTQYWTASVSSVTAAADNGFRFENSDGSAVNASLQISVKQVLTPSSTGVTIVSTKGGSTFNFALKNSSFDYNDPSGYTYEIIKVRQAVSIAGGAVTAANERLSLVDGGAFYFGSIDCRAGGYHDGRHWARFQDSSGYVAFAKIKAEEPAGETFGSETNSTANASSDPNGNEANATTTWLSDGATITSDGSVKTTGSYSIKADFSAGGIYATTGSGFTPIVGALYKIVADLKTENNARVITVDGTGTIIRTVLSATSDWVTKTEYITNKAGTNAYLGYYGRKAPGVQQGIVYIDNYSRKQVTVPPATGALLENMAGTRNMIYTHPSFNPNAIANIQILYVGD